MFRKFRIVQNMINERDAHLLVDHLDKLFKRRKYEGNHWDAVIANYKEIELTDKNTNNEIKSILRPIQEWIQLETNTASKSFLPIHAIDISAGGHIVTHVDNIKFSGGIIAGLSLVSTRILRLEKVTNDINVSNSYGNNKPTLDDTPKYVVSNSYVSNIKNQINSSSSSSLHHNQLYNTNNTHPQYDFYEFYLHPRSLYILQGPFRYDYGHSILGENCESKYLEKNDPIKRRISLMFRDSL